MNTQLHEMRISAKHLRYTLELFAPTYADDALAPTVRAARKLQNALGKLHDCDMWIDMLPRFYDAESVRHEKFHGHRRGLKRIETAIENLTEHQRTQRQQVYERFASYWHKAEAKGVWVELRDLLDNPPAPLTPTTADQPPVEDDTPEHPGHPSPPPHEPIVEVKTGLRPTHPMDN